MMEPAVYTFELTPVRGQRVYVTEKETCLGVVPVRVYHHPRACGHLVCQPNGPIAPQDERVRVRITECVFNHVSRRKVGHIRVPNMMFTLSPY